MDRVVEHYSKPQPEAGSYQSRQVNGPQDAVPVIIQGAEAGRMKVAEILP